MIENRLGDMPFRKSSFSKCDGGCVEIGVIDGLVRVRDTKDRDNGLLTFNAMEWEAFLHGVRAGEFDFQL